MSERDKIKENVQAQIEALLRLEELEAERIKLLEEAVDNIDDDFDLWYATVGRGAM